MAIFGNMIGGGGDASKYGTTGDYFAGTVIGANTYSIASWAFTMGSSTATYGSSENNRVMRRASFPNARVIGPHAFEKCYNLVELDFPNVTTIEECAFGMCSKLEFVSSGAFLNLDIIGHNAFGMCSKLKRFEASVKKIDSGAFGSLSSTNYNAQTTGRAILEYINVDYLEEMGYGAFGIPYTDINFYDVSNKTLNFPRVKTFASPFVGMSSGTTDWYCTSVNLPMLEELSAYAFSEHSSNYSGMYRFSEFTSPTLKIIGSSAFNNHHNNNTALTSFDLPNLEEVYFACINSTYVSILEFPKLKFIGPYAFISNGRLSIVSFPEYANDRSGKYSYSSAYGTYDHGYGAFSSCIHLSEAYLPKLGSIPTAFFSNCVNLVSVTLSSDIPKVGNYAFYSCYSLSNIDLSRIGVIGNCAFYSCKALPNDLHLENATWIGNSAFYGISSSTTARNVYLSSISSIHDSAFTNANIKYVYMSSVSMVPELSVPATSIFYSPSVTLTYLYVPSSLYSDFRADSYWSAVAGKFRSV